MTCERNARVVLGYLQNEEVVLKRLKEVLESQLMRLQIDEMNLRVAYQSLKSKKETTTKNGVEIKNEPKIKTEFLPQQQKINSEAETLELKTVNRGPISKTKRNVESLPELQLEPCRQDQCSDSEADVNEASGVFPEPLFPNSEDNSLDDSDF